MALDVNSAGLEFVKTVLTLYRSGKYFREKEILAKKLLDHTIETGRLVTELGVCPEADEDAIARQALDELNKALFTLKVMQTEGIYSERRTQPVTTLAEQLKETINLYVVENSLSTQPVQTEVQVKQPTGAPLLPNRKEQLALPAENHDSGGFNEPYYGK